MYVRGVRQCLAEMEPIKINRNKTCPPLELCVALPKTGRWRQSGNSRAAEVGYNGLHWAARQSGHNGSRAVGMDKLIARAILRTGPASRALCTRGSVGKWHQSEVRTTQSGMESLHWPAGHSMKGPHFCSDIQIQTLLTVQI